MSGVSNLLICSGNDALQSLPGIALSVSGAIFLILELDRPFHGLMQISSAPLRNALAHLDQ